MQRLVFGSVAFLMVACGGEARGPAGGEGESLGALEEAPATFELIQEGAFSDRRPNDPHYIPRSVHIGFANDRGGPWEGVRDIEITYASEKNEAVKVDVPSEHRSKRFLLYSLRYDAHSASRTDTPRSHWISDQAVKLSSPAGRFVTVAASSSSGYPFSDECYGVRVQSESFPGKLRGILYGFTKSSKSDYEANNDVPWQNVEGKSKHEGFLATDFQHDGGYKGTYVSRPIWVQHAAVRRRVSARRRHARDRAARRPRLAPDQDVLPRALSLEARQHGHEKCRSFTLIVAVPDRRSSRRVTKRHARATPQG
jgi:hypothetical protein